MSLATPLYLLRYTSCWLSELSLWQTTNLISCLQMHYRERHRRQAEVQARWNVMVHVQKPDFVFRRNGRVHLNRLGASVQSTTGSRGVRISGSNAGYTVFRGSVKGTGYPLHSPVSPSLPFPCVTLCHHISTGLYQLWTSDSNWMGAETRESNDPIGAWCGRLNRNRNMGGGSRFTERSGTE